MKYEFKNGDYIIWDFEDKMFSHFVFSEKTNEYTKEEWYWILVKEKMSEIFILRNLDKFIRNDCTVKILMDKYPHYQKMRLALL